MCSSCSRHTGSHTQTGAWVQLCKVLRQHTCIETLSLHGAKVETWSEHYFSQFVEALGTLPRYVVRPWCCFACPWALATAESPPNPSLWA